MTRGEFLQSLEFIDDVQTRKEFSVHGKWLAANDLEQRATIARLREALDGIVKIRFLLGNDPKLNPAYEMGDIAQRALNETT